MVGVLGFDISCFILKFCPHVSCLRAFCFFPLSLLPTFMIVCPSPMCFTHVQLSLPPSCIVCSLCQLVCLVSLSLFLCCHVLSPHSVFQVFDSSCYFWFALVLLTCTLFSACTFFCFCFLDFSGFVCCLFLPRVVACFLFFISWTLFFSFSCNLPACVSRVWVLFFFFATVSSVYMMDSVICSICRLNFFHTVMKTTLPVTTI